MNDEAEATEVKSARVFFWGDRVLALPEALSLIGKPCECNAQHTQSDAVLSISSGVVAVGCRETHTIERVCRACDGRYALTREQDAELAE